MKKLLLGLLAVALYGVEAEAHQVRVVNKTGRRVHIDVHFATALCSDDHQWLDPAGMERAEFPSEYKSRDSLCDLTSMGGFVEYPVNLTPEELIKYGIDAASYAAGTAIIPPHVPTRKVPIINMPDRQSAKSTQWVLVQLAKKTANDPDPKFGFVQVNHQSDIDSY